MRHPARLPAAAALACLLAAAACGEQPSGGSAGGDARTAVAVPSGTEIPDDFPLATGMGGPGDTIATSRTGTGLRDLRLCGTAPLRGLGVRDRMVADASGGESANTRELVLLGNPDEATLVAQALADLSTGCDPDDAGDMVTVTEVRGSPFGLAPAATLVQTSTFDGAPGSGTTVIHVVPVGAALLVTSTYGEWTGDALEGGVAETVDALRGTVDALAVFGNGPTTAPTEEPPGSATAVPAGPEISDDFPLGVGMPEDGGDFEVTAPSADGAGMGEVEMCGRVVWPLGDTSGGTRRLVTEALGPEYADQRELLVHADADAALDAMAPVHAAAQECRSIDHQVWTVLERDTGHDTVTMGLTWDDGLGSQVFQVTRVGSARLMVTTYGEGTLEYLDRQADEATETTQKIVPAMCVFTNTGC